MKGGGLSLITSICHIFSKVMLHSGIWLGVRNFMKQEDISMMEPQLVVHNVLC